MPAKKEVDLSEFANVTSPDLLVRFHAAKSIKNSVLSELIEREFRRRDRILVNLSILGKPKETTMEPQVIQEPAKQPPKLRLVKKTANSNKCPHCFCMKQQALFGAMETEMCCRCGKEKVA